MKANTQNMDLLNYIPEGFIKFFLVLIFSLLYLRILFLAFIFNRQVAQQMAIPFIVMFLIAFLISKFVANKNLPVSTKEEQENNMASTKNPLEFRTTALFGILFVIFALLTDYVLKSYGS